MLNICLYKISLCCRSLTYYCTIVAWMILLCLSILRVTDRDFNFVYFLNKINCILEVEIQKITWLVVGKPSHNHTNGSKILLSIEVFLNLFIINLSGTKKILANFLFYFLSKRDNSLLKKKLNIFLCKICISSR